MAAGRQAFSFVTGTSSDHMISLWFQGTQLLLLWTIMLWWKPTISHHSVLLIFYYSLLLMLFDHQISTLCQAWTKSKFSWCTSKGNNKFTFKTYIETTQNEKIKQVTKSKTWRLTSNALLGPSKRWKSKVCQDPTPPDTPSDSNTELVVPLVDESTEENGKQDTKCVFCTGRFVGDHNVEEWIRCA
jgi:hypothetical protein